MRVNTDNLAVIHARDFRDGDVYIGRRMPRFGFFADSPWANPFRVGVDGTRAEVIAKYRDWLGHQPALLARLDELRGKRLACWCKDERHPRRACHGDVLVALLREMTS